MTKPAKHMRYAISWPIRHKGMVLLVLACSLVPGLACGQEEPAVSSAVSSADNSSLVGRLSVDPEVDPTPDYRGFEVLIAVSQDGEPDTLGYAVTDSTGEFSMDVTAPRRGVYAIIISRSGQILKIGEIAVADADSARLEAEFPMGNRLLRIRSRENAAWMAYQNAKALYNQNLLELVQSGEYEDARASMQVQQTSSIMWNMRETFEGTMGAEMALSESVLMLAGWHDSLAVARAIQIAPDNIQYVEVARAARGALARLSGQEASLSFLRAAADSVDTEAARAELHAEIVVAHMDSLDYDAAREAARAMQEVYGETAWATWAERALYELNNLLPGMPAPPFALRTAPGDSLSLDALRGKAVVLEFYNPQDAVYQREYEGRNDLVAASDAVHVVSVSLQPDTLVNEAFFDERIPLGTFVWEAGGFASDVARRYNVNVLPTRYLIDQDGILVAKYVRGAMAVLREDALGLVGAQ